jgi:hypothetical protein
MINYFLHPYNISCEIYYKGYFSQSSKILLRPLLPPPNPSNIGGYQNLVKTQVILLPSSPLKKITKQQKFKIIPPLQPNILVYVV